MEHILLSTGLYDVVVANSGREAQEKFLGEKPDLVFLDACLPEMRNEQLLEFICSQEAHRKTRVVLMSGTSREVYFDDQDQNNQHKGPEKQRHFLKASDQNNMIPFSQDMRERYCISEVLAKPFHSNTLKDLTARLLNEERQKQFS
jgi:CheY-like chemotaxis protein